MNSEFASYVRSARFQLSLSEEMVDSLMTVDYEVTVLKKPYGLICHFSTSNALSRRGLIIPSKHAAVPKEWLEAPQPSAYDLTVAGKIVVALLKEAGFKPNIPLLVECADAFVPNVEVTLKNQTSKKP